MARQRQKLNRPLAVARAAWSRAFFGPCTSSRNGDKKQSRIGEKSLDRRGTQAVASRGLAGQATVLTENMPVRHNERFGVQESMRPVLGLVPSQELQSQIKYGSAPIPPNLTANVSPSITFRSNTASRTTLEHDTTMKLSNVLISEPECTDVQFFQMILTAVMRIRYVFQFRSYSNNFSPANACQKYYHRGLRPDACVEDF